MNSIDIINRHCGKPEFVEIKNEDGSVDKIKISPIGPEKYSLLMNISKYFENFDEAKLKAMSPIELKSKFEGFEDTMKDTIELCINLIMRANPELTDKEKVREFSENNFPVILERLAEMSVMSARDMEKKKKIDLIKGKLNGDSGISGKEQKEG